MSDCNSLRYLDEIRLRGGLVPEVFRFGVVYAPEQPKCIQFIEIN